MARIVKTILTADTHHSPEGAVVATPERIRRWAAEHARMRALGIRTPVCWGHNLAAVPHYSDEKPYLEAKFNAGYYDELRAIDGGRALEAVIDCPGVELDDDGNLITWTRLNENDPRLVKCAIGEVSAAVTRQLRDGRAKVWDDIISHIALTPYPVVTGQTGFKPLGLQTTDVQFLSLGARGWRLLGGSAMPFPPKDEKDDKGGKPADDLADDDVIEDEEADDGADSGEPDDEGGNADMQALVDLLAKVCNVHIPEGETPKQFCDQLKTILSHMSAAGGAAEGEPLGEGAANNAPVVAEESPQMMSLKRDNPELAKELKRLAEANRQMLADKQVKHRAGLAKKLELAAKYFPKADLDELAIVPQTACLSLHRETGAVTEPARYTASQILSFLLKIAKKTPTARLTKTLSTARSEPNPLRAALSRQPTDEESTEIAERYTGKKFPSRNGNGKRRKVRS